MNLFPFFEKLLQINVSFNGSFNYFYCILANSILFEMFNLIKKIVQNKSAKMIYSFVIRPNVLASRPFQSSVLLFSSSSPTVPNGVNFRGRGYPTYLHKGPSSLVNWSTVLSAWSSFIFVSLTTLALGVTGGIFFFNTFEKLVMKEVNLGLLLVNFMNGILLPTYANVLISLIHTQILKYLVFLAGNLGGKSSTDGQHRRHSSRFDQTSGNEQQHPSIPLIENEVKETTEEKINSQKKIEFAPIVLLTAIFGDDDIEDDETQNEDEDEEDEEALIHLPKKKQEKEIKKEDEQKQERPIISKESIITILDIVEDDNVYGPAMPPTDFLEEKCNQENNFQLEIKNGSSGNDIITIESGIDEDNSDYSDDSSDSEEEERRKRKKEKKRKKKMKKKEKKLERKKRRLEKRKH
uniref:Uncharacterized protein n=2 Tax=Meloidogyne TaxID=189290 RepID=A0A6V7TVF7_MELEN|nr:unnamed protein product [Meloidogyne enterolobii]